MARRGRMAAGFWMMQRQRGEGVVNPDNPYNLPEFILTGTPYFGAVSLTEAFVLIIL